MHIVMAGLEHSTAPIALREKLSFTQNQAVEAMRKIHSFQGISGCVLISTCNRTELYLHCDEKQKPGHLLCSVAGTDYKSCESFFLTLSGEKAVNHLMEVAAGFRSRIFGEDQIVSQVKDAIARAREAKTGDAVLETLFRTAVSAGKEVRTKVQLNALPTSAASKALELLQQKSGPLAAKKAVVIGNGKMGRLSAELLKKAGCEVAVTLRTYRHGETVVPAGCSVVPYEERFSHIKSADVLISATTSPHYTVTPEQMQSISHPLTMIDLAIPRDIHPDTGSIPGISLYNVDDLGDIGQNRTVPDEARKILDAHIVEFHRWINYRSCMGSLQGLERALEDRLLASKEIMDDDDLTKQEVIEAAVEKTVELLVGGLAEHITAEALTHCENKIRMRNPAHR